MQALDQSTFLELRTSNKTLHDEPSYRPTWLLPVISKINQTLLLKRLKPKLTESLKNP